MSGRGDSNEVRKTQRRTAGFSTACSAQEFVPVTLAAGSGTIRQTPNGQLNYSVTPLQRRQHNSSSESGVVLSVTTGFQLATVICIYSCVSSSICSMTVLRTHNSRSVSMFGTESGTQFVAKRYTMWNVQPATAPNRIGVSAEFSQSYRRLPHILRFSR